MQQWGTPDFDFTVAGAQNNWVHFCVTYDGTATKIFVNGLYKSQKVYTLTTGLGNFLLGYWNGSRFDGKLDEVRVWDKALDPATILAWHKKSVGPFHPDFANLKAYYPINEGTGHTIQDVVGGRDGDMQGLPDWRRKDPATLVLDMTTLHDRPNVVFEQGVYTNQIDTLVATDSLRNSPFSVVLYQNPTTNAVIDDASPIHPKLPTDTLYVWNSPNVTISPTGAATNTAIATPLQLVRTEGVYYSRVVPFEIGRYITPYGKGLDLTPDGRRWVFDVSDYGPVLQGKKLLVAGNNQELLDLQFIMIKGTPARNVRKIEGIYNPGQGGSYSYNGMWLGDEAGPQEEILDATQGTQWRVKTRTTGHGGGAGENCAEFCPKTHYMAVNGQPAWNWYLWTECATNFVYPQGGTWVYDRAGWCPGQDVGTYNWELTPLAQPGDTVTFDYDVEGPNGNADGNWVIQAQLVTYDAPNFTIDASLEQILAPTTEDAYSRSNPICGKPIVRVRNNGTTTITSLRISFGAEGGTECQYVWTGNIPFLGTKDITLPSFEWFGLDVSNPVFYARIEQVNNVADTYTRNNELRSPFTLPSVYYSGYILEIKSNKAASQNSWEIRNEAGAIVKSKVILANSKTYRDTLNMPIGCYTFRFKDIGNDGLTWWANTSQGSGTVKIFQADGVTVDTAFQSDFGAEIYHQFTMGEGLGTAPTGVLCGNVANDAPLEMAREMSLYPNPASGAFNVVLDLPAREDVSVSVFSMLGQEMFRTALGQTQARTISVQAGLPAGAYLVRVATPTRTHTQVLVVE